MAIKALNRKAEALVSRPGGDVRPFAFGDCCPGFLPGWEVSDSGGVDPCQGGWTSDIPLCQPGCYWIAQVGDGTSQPHWFDRCGNISQDWVNLCTVPDNRP
jgi:hypothetical protein